MSEEALQEFYKYVLLPQFGLEKVQIEWKKHQEIGPDDDAHYFDINNQQYMLIFKDYGAYSEEELKELIKLPRGTFEYVSPTSHSDIAPIYRVGFDAPSKYAHNVTGYFTLLKI